MSAHQPIVWLPEREREEEPNTPVLRLAEHAIGLWQAAQEMGDPVLLEALRPLMIQTARALARDVMDATEDETAH